MLKSHKTERKSEESIYLPANGHNGRGEVDGEFIPQARVRLHRPHAASLDSSTDTDGTHAHSNGNGLEQARVQSIRHVKVRISNGNGNGHSRVENGHTNGVSADTVRITPGMLPTTRLRDTDLTNLRLRLKTSEWTGPATGRLAGEKRDMPYFLMRHRNMRARSRVGHRRAQVAARKYGTAGPASIALRLMIVLFLLGGMVAMAGMGAAGAGAYLYMDQLPSVAPQVLFSENYQGMIGETSKIFDRQGRPLYDLVDEETGLRQETPLSEISPLVISATIATEDANFYSNLGVDPIGIIRAVNINLSGEGQSGGSTITQQVVRQVVLTAQERAERSMQRKIKEAVLAVQMTRTYSKDEILELYLNQNFYGHRAYGIGAASLTYFGKPPKDLSLSEASLLAGLPQAPTVYDPILYPLQARRRQAIVLDLMVKLDMITHEEADRAKSEEIVLRPYKPKIQAPHFVYYVKEYLEKKYGPDVSEAGLKIYTTIDLDVQAAAEKVARDRIDELRKQKATNASIVIMKPGTGEILAMVGSVDYNNKEIDGEVNVATRERQPGSSFKPITFAAAFEKGWTPATVLLDVLTAFPNPGQKPYAPNNYDSKDHGWVTVREALANSYNVPAVKGLQYAGVQETIDTAHDMGIKGLNRGKDWYGLSLTLGGGEVTLLDMTTAYSTFANNGLSVDANPILRVEDPQGRIIEQLDPNAPARQALDPRIAYMITDILSDNKARTPAFGPNSPLRLSFPAAAKTGTTDDNRDSWTMGYTPELTVGVWVGNSNNDEMLKVTGAIGAAVIWKNMMEAFYKEPAFVEMIKGPDGKLQKEFVKPDGLITRSACSNKGTVTDLFLAEAPPRGCTTYKDKNKQLRAAPKPGVKPAPTPQTRRSNTRPAPRPTRTPMPGIWLPDGTQP